MIEAYLPQQMSQEEVADVVREVIASTGAKSMADMGRVMGETNKRLAGKADGSAIAALVKELLSGG